MSEGESHTLDFHHCRYACGGKEGGEILSNAFDPLAAST